MKTAKIREWSVDDLKSKEREFSERLFRLKFLFTGGQADTLGKIRELRRDVARIKTILREQEIKDRNSKIATGKHGAA
jgi:large subunit ribosomal protein L29